MIDDATGSYMRSIVDLPYGTVSIYRTRYYGSATSMYTRVYGTHGECNTCTS